MLLSLFVVIAITPMAPWQCAHACLFYALLLPITVFIFSFFQEAKQNIPPSLSTYQRVCISHFPAVYRLAQGISNYFLFFEESTKSIHNSMITLKK
ncbi:hypothetical protein [Alcanivorax sp.]|jgi:hypothetical protein|uniref:hypothetical protein n=1 Tax=Alcanivorax sp. TaxID=1872427 RepID=UPI0025BEA92C|nr:hypothetical protein [Alcanivorax sp.]